MKLIILMTGRTRSSWLKEGIADYLERLGRYLPVEEVVLPDAKVPKGAAAERVRQLEGERTLAALQPGDYVALLDERGRELTSRGLAAWLEECMQGRARRLVVIIGGPYGFSREVYARADCMLSLSRLTFTHEMARLVVAEQLYRAMTIIKGESYHHD